jgi:hypothetical protein
MMPLGYARLIEIKSLKKTLPYNLTTVASSFFILTTLFFFMYSTSIISMIAKAKYYNARFLSICGECTGH